MSARYHLRMFPPRLVDNLAWYAWRWGESRSKSASGEEPFSKIRAFRLGLSTWVATMLSPAPCFQVWGRVKATSAAWFLLGISSGRSGKLLTITSQNNTFHLAGYPSPTRPSLESMESKAFILGHQTCIDGAYFLEADFLQTKCCIVNGVEWRRRRVHEFQKSSGSFGSSWVEHHILA